MLEHPLAAHTLAGLRDSTTAPAEFRRLTRVLTTVLLIEATKDLATRTGVVQTPMEEAQTQLLASGIAIIPILRAGLGMVDVALDLFPDVAVGYIGLEREETTAIANRYYTNLPDLSNRVSLCLDPMLATGGSASQALSLLKGVGVMAPKLISIVAAPQGVARVQKDHPDCAIITAALDRDLNAQSFILPGLGDYGDRLFST